MSGEEFFLDRYEKLGWKYKKPAPRQAIRMNTMNAEETNVIRRLEIGGARLQKIPFLEHGYWVSESEFSLGATEEYLLGYYSLQEAAAQIPATLFTRLHDKIVLDACAAPGGKTVQLADSMRNKGAIIALDIDRRRLNALTNHLERCNVNNTIVYNLDARQTSRLGMKFDRLLLDVPCSGNFATDENWLNRRTLDDVERNAKLQREILAEAAAVMRNDGEIVYSTCSLEPEEDELNVDWAIKKLNLKVDKINCKGEKAQTNIFGEQLDSQVENCRRIWPGEAQGFFVCKFTRADVQ